VNREEAKLILGASRSDDDPESNPDLRAALDLAKSDPILSTWLVRERALDNAIAAKLREAMTCPPGLKRDLLSARRVIRPSVWWRRPGWLAAAASLMLLAAVAGIVAVMTRPERLQDIRADLVGHTIAAGGNLGAEPATDLESTRVWLNQRGANTNFIAPRGLAIAPVVGRETFSWRRHMVSRVRFKLPRGVAADLYIIERPQFESPHCCDDAPNNTRMGDFSTTHWLSQEALHLLVIPGNQDFSELF
jgi:uncharacterized membrane protein YbaN (DUF454 family)